MIKKIIALETAAQQAVSQNQDHKGIQLRKQAIKLANVSGMALIEAVLLQRLGEIYESQDRVQDAIYMFEAALKTLNNDPTHDLTATFKRLQRTTKGYHEQELAIPDLYNPAIKATLEEAASDKLLPVRLMIQTGNMYLSQPQPIPALQFYEEALRQPGIEQASELKAFVLSNISEIFRQQGKLDEATTNLKTALSLFKKETEKRQAISMLASIAQQKENHETALEWYEKATPLYLKAQDDKGLCKIKTQLGQLFLQQHKLSLSKTHYEAALKLAKQTGDHSSLWHIYWGLGYIAAKEKAYETAVNYLDESLSRIQNRQDNLRTDEGKVAFLDSVYKVFELLIEVCVKSNQPKKAIEIVDQAKAQSLLDMMNGRKRRRAHQQPSEGQSPEMKLPDFDEPNPSDMMVQMATGVHSFSNMPAFPLDFPADEELKEEEKRIAPERNRLVFYQLNNEIYCWLVLKDGTIFFYCPNVITEVLQKLVLTFRESLIPEGMKRVVIKRNWKKLKKENSSLLAKRLFDFFIAPFQQHIQQLDELVIEPHLFLWTLPFAALLDKDGKYLIDYCPLFYAPSKTTLQEIEEEPPYATLTDCRILVMGNPAHMPQSDEFEMATLNGAEEEAKAIYQLFPEERSVLIPSENAEMNIIKSEAEQCNIIHLSTHGWANAEMPLESFIVLNKTDEHDGFLKVGDIMRWNLPAELVVLSACQTALGKVTGEGVISLTRAFLVAGARSVITTQWSIDDESCKLLMVRFYQYLLETENKGKALQLAMIDLKNMDAYCEPGYWAAFTLVGSTTTM